MPHTHAAILRIPHCTPDTHSIGTDLVHVQMSLSQQHQYPVTRALQPQKGMAAHVIAVCKHAAKRHIAIVLYVRSTVLPVPSIQYIP